MQHTATLARLLAATLFAAGTGAAIAADAAPATTAPAADQQVAQSGDAALTSQAQAALQQDKDLQALPLTVTSSAGVVVVKGTAPSAELAQKAVQVLSAVAGVKEVRNEIKVG